jgi:hypothetical protein
MHLSDSEYVACSLELTISHFVPRQAQDIGFEALVDMLPNRSASTKAFIIWMRCNDENRTLSDASHNKNSQRSTNQGLDQIDSMVELLFDVIILLDRLA